MLEKLLEEIRQGGTLETGALAKKLGTTPQLVEVMLEHLQGAGLIHPFRGCRDSCQACGEKGSCNAMPGPNAPRLWQG